MSYLNKEIPYISIAAFYINTTHLDKLTSKSLPCSLLLGIIRTHYVDVLSLIYVFINNIAKPSSLVAGIRAASH